MNSFRARLGLPATNFQMHQAILQGLPVSLIANLANDLNLHRSHIAKWVGTSFRHHIMSVQASETLYRLVETLDALIELHEGDIEGALRWLTSPVQTLARQRPVDLITTEPGRQAVMQVIHAFEYGLPA